MGINKHSFDLPLKLLLEVHRYMHQNYMREQSVPTLRPCMPGLCNATVKINLTRSKELMREVDNIGQVQIRLSEKYYLHLACTIGLLYELFTSYHVLSASCMSSLLLIRRLTAFFWHSR